MIQAERSKEKMSVLLGRCSLQAIADGALVPLQQPQKLLHGPGRLPCSVGDRLDPATLQLAELPRYVSSQVPSIGDTAMQPSNS